MKQCMDSDNLHRRLKKIMGQLQAIDRMVDEDVPCEAVLSQINAAKSALHKCGQVVLEVHHEPHRGSPNGQSYPFGVNFTFSKGITAEFSANTDCCNCRRLLYIGFLLLKIRLFANRQARV